MIVAFTKDWDDVPTCTTHILREMAKTIPVLWVSSIGTRKPSAASGKDVRRILGRILSGLKRAEWKENHLHVLKPILIPKAESAFAKWINRKVFAWYVGRELREVERGEWRVESGVSRALLGFEQRGSKGNKGDVERAEWRVESGKDVERAEWTVEGGKDVERGEWTVEGGKDVERGEWTVEGDRGEGVRCQVSDVQPRTRNSEPGTLEYWCFVPNAVDLLPQLRRSELGVQSSEFEPGTWNPEPGTKVVYYCADDWGQFHNLDGAWMNAKERELVERADAVFVTSEFLKQKLENGLQVTGVTGCRGRGVGGHVPRSTSHVPRPTVHYMPHGVEYARFATALDKTQPVPEDVVGLPKPIVGFYGNLHPWVDFAVVQALAVARPEWSFVMIGEKYADVSALEVLPNVHLLGRREHGVLHDYCRAFDVAIIPYDMSNPRMESVNPVKTKELLAAGLPVVASDVPELRHYGDDVLTCTGVDKWLLALDRQMARDDHKAISESVHEESWENKVTAIRTIVEESVEQRGREES